MSGSWVTDGSGTRWVEYPERKRRKPARAIRFADLKVGDQLMKIYTQRGWRGGKDDLKAPPVDLARSTGYYIVTDLWFDPVAGQRDEVAGRMAAIAQITGLDDKGLPVLTRKWPHTLRGLASQGYHFAAFDIVALMVAKRAAENVIGIRHGHTVRARPKTPGRHI